MDSCDAFVSSKARPCSASNSAMVTMLASALLLLGVMK